MCAERRLTSGELDELILKCLADGMGLHRIMQELYGACGVWGAPAYLLGGQPRLTKQ